MNFFPQTWFFPTLVVLVAAATVSSLECYECNDNHNYATSTSTCNSTRTPRTCRDQDICYTIALGDEIKYQSCREPKYFSKDFETAIPIGWCTDVYGYDIMDADKEAGRGRRRRRRRQSSGLGGGGGYGFIESDIMTVCTCTGEDLCNKETREDGKAYPYKPPVIDDLYQNLNTTKRTITGSGGGVKPSSSKVLYGTFITALVARQINHANFFRF